MIEPWLSHNLAYWFLRYAYYFKLWYEGNIYYYLRTKVCTNEARCATLPTESQRYRPTGLYLRTLVPSKVSFRVALRAWRVAQVFFTKPKSIRRNSKGALARKPNLRHSVRTEGPRICWPAMDVAGVYLQVMRSVIDGVRVSESPTSTVWLYSRKSNHDRPTLAQNNSTRHPSMLWLRFVPTSNMIFISPCHVFDSFGKEKFLRCEPFSKKLCMLPLRQVVIVTFSISS